MGRKQILPDRPLTVSEKGKRYRMLHPETSRENVRRWAAKNKDRIAASDRARREANPDKHSFYFKRWRLANPAKSLERSHRYRARKRAATVDKEGVEKLMHAVFVTPFQLCFYCSEVVVKGRLHFDHVLPITKGGTHEPDNLVVSCPRCNHSKRERTLAEWKKRPRVALGFDGSPFGWSPLKQLKYDRYWGRIPWIPNWQLEGMLAV